jgi:hypothetical protein
MATLFDQIVQAVAAERFIVSNHADDRLRERMIELWQLTSSLDAATFIDERPNDVPIHQSLLSIPCRMERQSESCGRS